MQKLNHSIIHQPPPPVFKSQLAASTSCPTVSRGRWWKCTAHLPLFIYNSLTYWTQKVAERDGARTAGLLAYEEHIDRREATSTSRRVRGCRAERRVAQGVTVADRDRPRCRRDLTIKLGLTSSLVPQPPFWSLSRLVLRARADHPPHARSIRFTRYPQRPLAIDYFGYRPAAPSLITPGRTNSYKMWNSSRETGPPAFRPLSLVETVPVARVYTRTLDTLEDNDLRRSLPRNFGSWDFFNTSTGIPELREKKRNVDLILLNFSDYLKYFYRILEWLLASLPTHYCPYTKSCE